MIKLSKSICQMCFKQKFPNYLNLWNEIDENRWKKGRLFCLVEKGEIGITVEKVPEGCPFFLEQIVSNDKVEK